MATLSVWKFPWADGAEKAEGTQAELVSSNLSRDQEQALSNAFSEDH